MTFLQAFHFNADPLCLCSTPLFFNYKSIHVISKFLQLLLFIFFSYCESSSSTGKAEKMAAALVGGALLSASLQVLFDRMASRPVLDFFRARKFSDSQLKKLEIKLLAIDAVLNDAEEKQITNPSVKKWVDELKDVVYDAEDLVDEIATEALQFKLGAKAGASSTDQVRNVGSNTTYSIGVKMERKIEEILDRLEYIVQQKDVLRLKQVVGWKPSQRLPSTSLVEDSGVYGRDQDKEKILEMLELDDHVSVTTIVGMGGVGKTTLAQLVYNDEKLKDRFDLKAWVCVSEDFDVLRVTKAILQACDIKDVSLQLQLNSAYDIKDLNFLQLKLKESLTSKKFLLVLDDVWSENYNDWDVLQKPFSYGAKGSKIIVTTRSDNVVSTMGRGRAYHLNRLSDEDCWLLFAKHAFDYHNSTANQELEVIGKRIAAKCKGLPLAAKALGGLLRSNVDVADWYELVNSKPWELSSNILPALRLSYLYLPSYLKRCFAYCSIFPKDYEFEKQEVILLWMAQDLLHDPHGSKQMEQVGAKYFDDLVSRSLFQRSSRDETRFVMHDLVNDLANVVSGEFGFRLENDNLCRITGKTRHLSYLRKEYNATKKFEVLNGVKRLRTFLPLDLEQDWFPHYINDQVQNNLLPGLSCLRVLSLSRYINIEELPESIGKMRHLRYLDLSETPIKKLPNSIGTLSNLQTLLLSKCSSLAELPTCMESLTNLRHLDVRGTNLKEMPIHIGRLTNLQTLSTFIVGKHEGSRIMELKRHNNLQGALDILNLENLVTAKDGIEANLKDKMHLDEISLQWSPHNVEDSTHARDALDKLRPHKKLKKLTIVHYGGTRYPNWLGDHLFSKLVFLCLSNFKHCFFLPPLGQLPSLQELHIISFHQVMEVGPQLYGYGHGAFAIKPFECLKILKFKNMLGWEDWFCTGDEGCNFPSLRELVIEDCPKLKGNLPTHLPCLTSLVIRKCEQLVASLPRAPLMCEVELDGCDKLQLSTHKNDIWLHSSLNVQDLSMQVQVQSSYCSSLQDLKISNMLDLKEFPLWLVQSTAIKLLRISNCTSLKSFPMSGLPTTLEGLEIEHCGEMDLLLPRPDDDIKIGMYSSSMLKMLHLEGSCDSLKSFPLGLFPKLKDLQFSDCANLSILFIPEEVEHNITSLERLVIDNCPKLVSFPRGELPLPNLTSLGIYDCKSLKSLPQQMRNLLPLLEYFGIWDCPEIESFPEGGLPSNLIWLNIHNCNKLTARRIDWGLQSLSNLQSVEIDGCEGVGESFPEEWLLPSSLTSLTIGSLPNLNYLDERGLQHLSSLQELTIWSCFNLQRFPQDCLPESVSVLQIWLCPLLEQRCQRDIGQDWANIAHIPTIMIDGKPIF